ncbi:MAG: hypothetical protein H5T69_01625 [Chloroflexi bacterium]|nr:hypothetical protein [Chloroflexota bacterium]
MMQKGRRSWVLKGLLGAITLLGAMILVGCQMAAAKSERASADWSRGEKIGQAALNDRVALAVAPLGDSVYLAWVSRYEGKGVELLRFARLDGTGRIGIQKDLPIGVDRPTEVSLLLDGQDHLHLTWTAQLKDRRRLFHARLDPSGQLASYPRPLSPESASVHSYTAALNGDGHIDIVWSAQDGEGQGLYHLRLNTWGDVVVESHRLREAGFDPALQVDREGRLHLAWQEEPAFGEHSILYAALDPADSPATLEAYRLATFPAPTGVVARRPSVGIAGDQVFVFWSRERRGGGMTPPSAESYYVVLPLGRPQEAGEPSRVSVPALNHPALDTITSGYNIREVARPGQAPFPSQFVYLPATARPAQGEVAAAFTVELGGRTKNILQIVTTFWADGDLLGYQIAGKTRNSSLKPALAVDGRGDLHLAWIDTAGFGSFEVYYASTAEAVRAHLNRITATDVVAAFFDLLWAMVQGISFLPITLAWVFVPLAVIALYLFIGAEGDLARRGPRIVLVVAVVLYVGFKYLFRPGWLVALPLPRRIPAKAADALIYATPLIISTVAGVVAWLYAKKRAFANLLATFILFAGCDALLTLLVYVPGVLRE